jgi:hypothetical protein
MEGQAARPSGIVPLHRVNGPEEFYDDLRLARGVHTGTMDFYKDLVRWRKARDRTGQSPASGAS